jgi:hypothetical protein
MLNLYHIYDKFLTLFRSNKSKNQAKNTSSEEHIATLFFGILDSDKEIVDIKCLLPNVENKNSDEIIYIAEKYAQLLVLINSESFNKNISDILNSHKTKNQENYKQIMLIDNIVSFWDILYNMQNKKYYQKYKSTQPLIRPSEAFKLK